jgi:hypothetical protein
LNGCLLAAETEILFVLIFFSNFRDDGPICCLKSFLLVHMFCVVFFVHCQTGYVAIGGEEYIIEPIKGHRNASADEAPDQREHPHLIYKRSALSAADEKANSRNDDDGHGTCGNDGLCLNFSFLSFLFNNYLSSSTTAFTKFSQMSRSIEFNVKRFGWPWKFLYSAFTQ